MRLINRQTFLASTASAAAAIADVRQATAALPIQDAPPPVDFRYAPPSWQATYCFPADPFKSMIGERGELRYGLPNWSATGPQPLPVTGEFSAHGVDPDNVMLQTLEAPGVPIIHTRIERPEAILELTTFATNAPGEGRVDNTILEIRPRTRRAISAFPLGKLRTRREVFLETSITPGVVRLDGETRPVFFITDSVLLKKGDSALGTTIIVSNRTATDDRPLRCFFRFPQEGQTLERIQAGLKSPDRLIEEARN